MRNAWGGFTFRAHWLNQPVPEPGTLIGITVRHQEPLAIKLWRKLETLPLSRRQAQLCLLMTSGLSYAAIAKRMGIAESTVIDHSRHIYNKLDVHNRMELMSKLLTL